MTTPSSPKHIQYCRSTGDHDAYYDGEYIGSFSTYHQAEVELDAHALDLLERGLVNSVADITTMQWQPDTVHARPAEVAEPIYQEYNANIHLLNEIPAGHRLADKSEAGWTFRLSDGSTVWITDALAGNGPGGSGGGGRANLIDRPELIHGRARANGSVVHAFTNDAPVCGSNIDRGYYPTTEEITCKHCLTALPAAPRAAEDTVSPDAPDTSLAAGRMPQPEATQPAASDLTLLCIEGLITYYQRGDGTVFYTVPGDLTEHAAISWPARETHCQHLTACASSVCPACAPPERAPFRCPLCATNEHRATACPEIKRERERQIEQAKWGESMFWLYRNQRDILQHSLRTVPQIYSERAEALALYLGNTTGVFVPVPMVERHLVRLADAL